MASEGGQVSRIPSLVLLHSDHALHFLHESQHASYAKAELLSNKSQAPFWLSAEGEDEMSNQGSHCQEVMPARWEHVGQTLGTGMLIIFLQE